MMLTLALVCSAALVLLNAFFVASEFAIVKVRSSRLEALAATGNRRARLALGMTRRLDVYLSANQLGITLASLALGWIGEPAFTELLSPLVAKLGASVSSGASHGLSMGAGFLLITLLHTVVGELVPKSLAIQQTEATAMWTAGPLRAFYFVMLPVIWLLNGAAALVLRVLHLRQPTETEDAGSPEEMRLGLRRVLMDPGARRLIDRVFDYPNRVVRHVMTQRRDVVALRADRPFDENLAVAASNQYSRYPILDAGGERVLGYLHAKDLLVRLVEGRKPRHMRELARAPIYTTEDAPLDVLRRQFQARRVHLAAVLNEAGAFSGIVTLEDLLEPLVGEIRDEQDGAEVPPLVHSGAWPGTFEADGGLTLDVVARELRISFGSPPPAPETLDEMVRARIEGSVRPGRKVVMEPVRFTILEVRDGKIRRLRGDATAGATASPHPPGELTPERQGQDGPRDLE